MPMGAGSLQRDHERFRPAGPSQITAAADIYNQVLLVVEVDKAAIHLLVAARV